MKSPDEDNLHPSAGRAGRRQALWAAIFAIGGGLWIGYALAWDPPRAWRAMLINFIYFSPLASGMVVWPAIVMLARGGWTGRTQRTALAAVAYAPVSLGAFAALVLGRQHWAAWMHEGNLPNAAWLNAPFLFARDGACLTLLWALAVAFVLRARKTQARHLAGWLVLGYCIVWTVLGFDLVMALDPHWYSTLFGGYFFISGLYIAVAAWTFTTLRLRPTTERPKLSDLGKLVVTFSLLTTYMMFSQLIVVWYENLPAEVRFVIPRLALAPWKYVSAALLAAVYLGPLVFLLGRHWKTSPAYLTVASLLVLAGMWVERWWLVTPTLGGPLRLGVVELSSAAAFAAALAFCVTLFHEKAPLLKIQEPPPRAALEIQEAPNP